jgi:predicted RNase H-like HicB family nuclease
MGEIPSSLREQNVKRKHVFQVIVEQDETGYFVAECPALKACYTQGKTYEEVVENIKDVISLCLADLKAKRKPIPRQPEIIGIKRVEVAV